MTPFELLLVALASYRLTRLAVRDELTRPLRERWLEPLLAGLDEWQVGTEAPRSVRVRARGAYLVSCPWCLSIHVAGCLYGAWALWPDLTLLVARILGAAAVAGLLLDRDRS